jgi:hypothetical protein
MPDMPEAFLSKSIRFSQYTVMVELEETTPRLALETVDLPEINSFAEDTCSL